jgi:acetyltransferase
MFSIDSANNSRMRELARDLGFARERDPDDSTQVIHRLTL